MARLTRIYTRTGDGGTTALGTGARVPKTAARIVAYGTIDELNAVIGLALASRPVADLVEPLRRIQNELLHAGAELCVPERDREAATGPTIEQRHVHGLEMQIDKLNASLEPLKNFVLPGGDRVAAHLHMARTICRRAERTILMLAASEPVGWCDLAGIHEPSLGRAFRNGALSEQGCGGGRAAMGPVVHSDARR